MKMKNFIALLGLVILVFTAACSKTDTNTGTANTLEGKWESTITRPVGPSNILTFNFKAGGTFTVDASSTSTTSLATGTWVLATDSVRATYSYLDGTTGTFSMAGKPSADFKTMNGTIGTGNSTSGYAVFMATK